jgi:hypothetical protein
MKSWDSINRFNSVTILCLSQARIWISIVICCGLSFVLSELRLGVIVRFVDIGGIDDLCELSFHK